MFFEIILIILLISFGIYVFYVPVYWIRDLNDVGYFGKPSAINRARKLRKIGTKIPPPFPNGWFVVAESREVKPGMAISVSSLGENFAIFRSKESKNIYILDAYCPHMGANLGLGGIVRDECIECPFHEWKFDGATGNCVGIPYSDGLPGLEKSTKVKTWQSKEVNGLIFLWYHREDENPWNIPVVEEIDNELWSFHGKNEFFVNAHIQDLPENGADVAHLKSVHSSSILTGVDIRFTHTNLFSFFGTHVWDAKWKPDQDDKHVATIHLTHFVNIFSMKMMKVTASIKQVGPGYVLLFLTSDFGPMVILQTVTPVEPLVQKMCHYFYAPRHLAWLTKLSVIAESINVSRDIAIWNNKRFESNPILPKEDKLIKQFRSWYSQFYSDNSLQFSEVFNNDLDW